MFASKFMDIVVGVDLHIEAVPSPAGPVPVPFPIPFVGMIFDPAQLASTFLHGVPYLGVVFMALDPIGTAVSFVAQQLDGAGGNPVVVNGLPATTTETDVTTRFGMPHMVIPPGVVFLNGGRPLMEGNATFPLGSSSVWINGRRAVRVLLDPPFTCSDPVRLPTGILTPGPNGAPVLVGGAPTPDLKAMVTGAVRSRVTRGLKGAIGPRIQRWLSGLSSSRLRNACSIYTCFATGHPVDVASGRMFTSATDWQLPGPIPLVFERIYSSAVSDRSGSLGFGWNHPLEQSVWVERGRVVYRGGDGREAVFDTFDLPGRAMRVGDEVFEPFRRLTLRCTRDGWEVEDIEGLVHTFRRLAGDRRSAEWRLVSIRARDGHEVTLDYASDGTLEWVRDSEGRLLRFEHDAQGRLLAISLPHPSERGWVVHTRYGYSRDGNLVTVTDPLGYVTRYEYAGHLMVRETDRTGLSFHFGYDGIDQSAWCVRTWGDGGLFDHEIDYDKERRQTFVTNSLGATTIYRMNEALAVIEVVDPHGASTRYEYDAWQRKVRQSDATGAEVRWEYDARGNCTLVTEPNGSTRHMIYSEQDQCIRVTAGTGVEWSWEYDREGREVRVTRPDGQVEARAYDAGRLVAIGSEGATATTVAFDPTNHAERITLPNGGCIERRYDRLGRMLEERSPVGGIVRLRYNARDEIVAVTDAVGITIEHAYDPEGNLVDSRSPTRHVTLVYGGGRRVVALEEGGTRVGFEYDTEDRLTAVVNEAGERYSFLLDATGRVVEEQLFDGQARSYTRDPVGRVTETRWPSGRTTQNRYDAAGRLTSVLHNDGTFTKLSHGPTGLLAAETEHGRVEFERDVFGRITVERAQGREVRSVYARDGGRAEMTTSLGARVVTTRDALGQIKDLFFGPGNDPPDRPDVHVERDLAGTETSRRFRNGIDVAWARDPAGRPTARHIHRTEDAHAGGPWGAGTVLRELDARTYQWRGADQIAAIVDAVEGPRFFDHDARGRLIRERTPHAVTERTMDVVGNVYRQQSPEDRVYGAGGRLLEADGSRYEHDADGNLVARIDAAGARWRYQWNGRGMLDEVERPDGVKVRFEYDAFARLTARRVLAHDGSLQNETHFVWDQNALVHECDAEEGLSTWYWESDSQTPVAKDHRGRRWAIASDHLGTPSELYDAHGELAWRMQLDVWGGPTFSGDAHLCDLRWPGQWADRTTGLVLNRFRAYDPAQGMYVSADPLGIVGAFAAYGYPADPTLESDPLGLNKALGDIGERFIADLLARRGHQIIGSMQNGSGQGVDLVTQHLGTSLLSVYEIKVNSSRLTPAQRLGAEAFVRSRAAAAIAGFTQQQGHWRNATPATVALATRLLNYANKFGSISGAVIRVSIAPSGAIRVVSEEPWCKK